MFGTIVITTQVANEFGQSLPEWFEVQDPSDRRNHTLMEQTVDSGEASAIALALEYDDPLLIIDDLKGRKLAAQLGIAIIGVVGIIINAKISGIVTTVIPILQKIKHSNFRISPQLEKLILDKTGEG